MAGEDPVEEARLSRRRRERLAVVSRLLRARRDACEGSDAAAIEVHRRARAKYDRDRHHDSFGWPRELAKLERLVDLGGTIEKLKRPRSSRRTRPVPKTAEIISRGKQRLARWKVRGGGYVEAPVVRGENGAERVVIVRHLELTIEEQRMLSEHEAEHRALCEELGYEHPFDSPKLQDMLAIAKAVHGGHDPDPDRPPARWPETACWLRAPAAWDPDLRVSEIVRGALHDGPLLLRSREAARLLLAWCVDLALDSDRSTLGRVLALAGEENHEIAGATERLLDLLPDGCSPIRSWLAWNWGSQEDNPARSRLLERWRGGGAADPALDDLAESATDIDLATLDAFLLDLAEELVETFPQTTAEGQDERMDSSTTPDVDDSPLDPGASPAGEGGAFLVYFRLWVDLPGSFPDVSPLDAIMDRDLPVQVMPLCRTLFPGCEDPRWRDDSENRRWLFLDLDDGGRGEFRSRVSKQAFLAECESEAEAERLVYVLNECYRPGEDLVDLAVEHVGLPHHVIAQVRFGMVARATLSNKEHIDAVLSLRRSRNTATLFLLGIRENQGGVKEFLRSTEALQVAGKGAGENPGAIFVRERKVWRITFAGRTASFPDTAGLRRIHTLLDRQPKEVPVEDLLNPYGTVRLSRGLPAADKSDLAAYRRQVDELRAAIESTDDPAEVVELEETLETLEKHVARLTGAGGQARRVSDDAASAGRTVGTSIKRAIDDLEEDLPELANHLRRHILTPNGLTPAYHPEERVDWLL